MTRVRRINVSQVEGDSANNNDTNEIRPYGELAVYIGDNEKLELLMFDGVRTHVKSKLLNKGTFFGGDEDSGDGAGYDTIKLVPDEELRRNGSDQYVIIDPTGPNHVHIRAGGTIDNSNADFYIGGEKNYLRISDSSDNVAIGVDDNNGSNKLWEFTQLGKFLLPPSQPTTSPEIYATTVYNNGLEYQGVQITPDPNFDVGQGLKIYPTAPNPEINHLHLTANTSTVDLFIGDDYRYVKLASNGFVEICGNGLTVWGDGVLSSYAYMSLPNNSDSETVPVVIGNYTASGVLIQAGSVSPPHNWFFGGDGHLIFPTNGHITFDSSATSNIYGVSAIEFADSTSQSTAMIQGEYIYEFAGTNTDITITDLNFNLLYTSAAVGYFGTDTHNINIPTAPVGQRLVVFNNSTLCILTINAYLQVDVMAVSELIYTSTDGWKPLYGATSLGP